MENKVVLEIEEYYNVQLQQIVEDDREYSKVEYYKNENTYSLDSNKNLVKLNLKNNLISDLTGLLNLADTITHLNLASTGLKNIDLLANFKKLKQLDLSANEIFDIKPISNLKELENLYLDSNLIEEIPKFNLPKLETIWLDSNRISVLDNLSTLQNIYSLNLSHNQILNINVLKNLKNLNQIYLNNNKIKDISVLVNFKTLAYLDLSSNEIEDLTPLKHISITSDLKISQNKIFDLSPLYFSFKKRGIHFLNAFENPLVYPPIEIVLKGEDMIFEWFEEKIRLVNEKIINNKKTKSPRLEIGNAGLTDLSMIPELFKLAHLKELIVSNEWAEYEDGGRGWIRKESGNRGLKNNLYNIPPEISKLTNLEIIIIGGDWKSKHEKNNNNWRLKDISSLFKLKKITFLNVSNNQIENISKIVNLLDLEIAHINNNEIRQVPNLSNLKELKEIYLSNNQIENIDFLKNCVQIETVDLHSNKIFNLIPLGDLLRKSNTNICLKNSSWEKKCISISNNSPNINPPYEILGHSNDSFFLYIKQLEYESKLDLNPYYNKEIKIILVGNSSSGKSTILNYLKTKRIKKRLPITHWLVTEELKDIKIGNDIFKLRFFDFGGQDYYHDTHKIFFSSDSVYLLMWDSKSNFLGEIEDDRNSSKEKTQVFPLGYWLDSIRIYGKKSLSESQRQMEQLLDERDRSINSKIRNRKKGNWVDNIYETDSFLNKIDNYRNVLIIQNKIEATQGFLNQIDLTKNYSNIFDFVNISLFEKKGIEQFKELYIDVIKRNLNYNRPLLATWGYVKDNLNNIFKGVDFVIKIDVFQDRINKYLTSWLEVYLNKSQSEISKILFNKEEIVLFANFLREIGLIIYNSEQESLKDSIIVHQNIFLEEVYKILDVCKEKEGEIKEDDLSEIKHKEQVIQSLINHKIIFKGKNNPDYIAPLFLPEKPNLLIDLLADVKVPFRRFKFKGFIPKSIILSIFSEIVYKQDISEEDFYYWKNGLVFKDKSSLQKIFLKFNIGYEYGCAYIDIFNFESNGNNNYLKQLTRTIKEIIDKEGISADELLTLDGIYYVDLKKLIFNYENKISHIITESFEDENTKHVSVYKFNKLMDDKIKKPNKKLFISYSKQDEKLVNNFIEHLSTLQSSGVIDSWYCTELKGGEDWDLKIKEKLNEADIVCFMISPKFMSTPYIHKYEVKETFKRYQSGENVKIIPIILDYIDWSRKYHFTSNSGEEFAWSLNKFTALPFTGKEIKEFKNENKAWYLVVNAIKIVLEEDINSEKDEDDIVRKFSNDVRRIYEDIIDGKI